LLPVTVYEDKVDTYAKAETLGGALIAPAGWAKRAALVVAFSLLIALSAQVVVPLPWTPVPVTLQTFAVLLTGALLGSRLGALAVFAYLLEGASGLPFFSAGRGGAAHLLFAPTAGYLLAYPAAAFVTGLLAERGWDRRYLSAAAAMAVGSAVVLAGGWLGLLRFYPATQAFALGVAPFLAGDVIKIALAAAVLPSGRALVRKKR
jgi:biotin transport system substrate-specific component